MAVTNVQVLHGAQAKIEAVRGTPEATMTRWLYPTLGSLIWTYEQDVDALVEANRSYHGHSAMALGRYRNRITYEERVSYEDVVWWMNAIMDGGNLTGSTTGSTPPGYTYTMTPQTATDDLATFTLKAGFTGNVYKFERCCVNKATFKFDSSAGNPTWLMTLEIWARIVTPGATFDALSERARTIVNTLGTALYLDEPGGTIGTTAKVGYLRSGEIVIDNQIEEKFFSEDTATSAVDFGRGEQLFTGSVVMEFKDDTEFAKMRAGTSRKLRIQQTGALIGSTPTTNFTLRFDFGVAQWMAPTFSYNGQNAVMTHGFMGYKSATVAVPMTAVIINASTTIAA